MCWPPSRSVFSAIGAVPFAFVGAHNSAQRTFSGTLLINVRDDEDVCSKVHVSGPANHNMLADVVLEPFQRSFEEIEAAAIVMLGVKHEAVPSPVAEGALAAEVDALLFCVKKYQPVRCANTRDVALALRLVIAELAPFLDAGLRTEFIDWYCGQLVDDSQDIVFVYRKPLLRPKVMRG